MNNLVIMKDQQAVTSSLQVAETFKKEHKNVIRDIEKLLESGSSILSYQMFLKSTYENRGKQYPMYYMNRDGFTLLAMGFTGGKAMKFKLAFIKEFNKMENQLQLGYSTKNVGGYQVPADYRGALLLAADLQEQVQVMKPKATYYDQIMANKALMTITTISKDYGMSASEFNKMLHNLKIQFKQSGTWYLYSKYQGLGWTSSSTTLVRNHDGSSTPRINTKWTQRGRVGLYNLLKQHDIVPMIEKLDVTTVTIGGK